MRRHPIAQLIPYKGYADGNNPLMGDAGTWAAGSRNQLLLGNGITRPWKGFTSKGTSSGSRIMVQLGNSWGGLEDYSSVTAAGSLIKDFNNNLYGIGAGKFRFENSDIVATGSNLSIVTATDVNTATDTITSTSHGMATGDQVMFTAGTLPSPTTLNTNYFVINTGANTFKLATSLTNALASTAIDLTTTGSGTLTLTKGVQMSASTLLKVATGSVTSNWYTNFDQCGLAQPAAPTIAASSVIGSGYSGLITGAMSFKVAAIRNRSLAGSNLTDVNAPSKSIASTTSAVVAVTNNTIQITFPSAVTGQTHWAVFGTKQGFGGTGVHYRVGYRTSSGAGATWIWGIPETTVNAAPGRTLEFDFKDGDLYPEEAWLYDYPPPAGTHFVRLQNIGIVFGCYSGTIAAVSLPNFFESYNPRHLLYFPEPVVGVLHRQIDDFAYVACRNSIHAVQYVGFRGDDTPSATITTILPEVGIAKQCNWAAGAGFIAAWIEGAGPVLISGEGDIDYDFGKEVAGFTASWDTSTVVSFNPSTRSFVFANAGKAVSFCIQSKAWSCPHYVSDAGVTGNWLSGINAKGELVASVDNAGTHTAYSYDIGASRIPSVFISPWMTPATAGQTSESGTPIYQSPAGPSRGCNIYELEVSVRQGTNTEPVILGIHKNLFTPYQDGVSVSNGSNIITGTGFTTGWTGKQVSLFGTNIGGGGVNYLIGTVTYSSPTQLTLTDRNTGATLNAQASASGMFMLVGEDFFIETPTIGTDQHLLNEYPAIQDARSFAISVWQATDGITGGVLDAFVCGTFGRGSEVTNG